MRAINVIFELSMPGRGSWNGKWSGAGKKYTVSRRLPQDSPVIGKSFLYHWDDGWTARIATRRANGEKPTNEFCQYDWMVDSIIRHGKIRTS